MDYFIGIPLAKYLLDHDTYLIGTLRSNRAGSGSAIFKDDLSRGRVYGLQNKDCIKLIRWKDKNDALMISMRLSYSASVIDSGKFNFQNESIMKFQVVLDYKERRQGTSLSDQLLTYHTCLRKSVKWYHKVAFELGLETALVNSYLIYKENYAESKVTILQFRESLVRSLLLDTPIKQQVTRSANSLITSLKKRKDLLTMFDDAVSAAMRRLENKDQEKRVQWQEKE